MSSRETGSFLAAIACGVLLARCAGPAPSPATPTAVVTTTTTTLPAGPIVETFTFSSSITRNGWAIPGANINVRAAGAVDVWAVEIQPTAVSIEYLVGLRSNSLPSGSPSAEGSGGPQTRGAGPELYGHWDQVSAGQYTLSLSPLLQAASVPAEGYAMHARVVVRHP